METFVLERGDAPLLISLPHDGSTIPEALAARLHPAARRAPDTDWHVARLYAPLARALGASVLRPIASRYVIDLNRPADGQALYPGRRETGLVPTIGFDGEPLYLDSAQQPDAAELQHRIADFWKPYHAALQEELVRLRALHGRVVLWEGHSIRGRVPMLFEGELPDFNLGTVDGASCTPALQRRLEQVLQEQVLQQASPEPRYSAVVNGRFKGGYITRAYGRPDAGIDAVQLELAQRSYMDEASFEYDERKAAVLQRVLGRLLRTCLA